MRSDQRLQNAAIALIAIQLIHGAIPAKTKSEGYVGLVLGIIALIASIAALTGFRKCREWARPLLGLTGGSVAVGFLLYHTLPIHSAVTNPYVGESGIGVVQWLPVFGAIGVGVWAAWEAYRASPRVLSST